MWTKATEETAARAPKAKHGNINFSYIFNYNHGKSSNSSNGNSSKSDQEPHESSTTQRTLPLTPENSCPSSPHQRVPSSHQRVPSSSSRKSLPLTLPFHAPLRAHEPIGIYHDQYHYGCLFLALSVDGPPISYVTVQRLHSPPVALHLTGSASSPIIATAQYNHSSSATELKTAAPTSAQRGITETLDKATYFSSSWAMNIFVPSSGCQERFEWRCNAGPEVAALVPKAKGLELVRVRTGEVVAVFGRTNMSARKVGKFQWCSEEWYGEEGDMMFLISLLALTEKMRRGEMEME